MSSDLPMSTTNQDCMAWMRHARKLEAENERLRKAIRDMWLQVESVDLSDERDDLILRLEEIESIAKAALGGEVNEDE